MMGWSTEQQNRLNTEWQITQSYFPIFRFRTLPTGDVLEGTMETNSNKSYGLRLYVPNDLPNSVPDVVITSPNPVYDYHRKSLIDYNYSATMHLLSPKDGYPRICTYKSTHWNPNRTFYNVLMKVRIWLEALDAHQQTGKPLDVYLTHQL
jgi:hypothetical protein